MVLVKPFIVMASSVNIDHDHRDKCVISSSSLGFIKFLEGFYMIVITRRSQIARIGYHRIYKIDETITLGITNEDVKKSHPDESKYEELISQRSVSITFL